MEIQQDALPHLQGVVAFCQLNIHALIEPTSRVLSALEMAELPQPMMSRSPCLILAARSQA